VKEKLVFTEGMSVESSKNQSVTSITQVQTKGRKTRSTIDMSRSNVALHIGRHDPKHDFLLSFFECSTLFRGQIKFSEVGGQINFSGKKTRSSFLNEQKKASTSLCKLENNFFLFITNAEMTEAGKKAIASDNSIFVNKSRWTNEYSPIFEFLKDHSKNKE
jgi:hypothetical protein